METPAQFLYVAEIVAINGRYMKAKIVERQALCSEPEIRVGVAMAWLTKQAKWEWILQKGTELGASAFFMLPAERSNVPLPKAFSLRQQRWRDILHDAAVQSGRGRIPTIARLSSLEEFLLYVEKMGGKVLLAHPSAKDSFAQVAKEVSSTMYLLIGPEGGFTEREVQKVLQYGGQVVTLGSRILRAETAALALLTLVLYS